MSKYHKSRIKTLKKTIQSVLNHAQVREAQLVADTERLRKELDAANTRISELAQKVVAGNQNLLAIKDMARAALSIEHTIHAKEIANIEADHLAEVLEFKRLAELASTSSKAQIRTLQDTITALHRTTLRELGAGTPPVSVTVSKS